MRRAAFTITEVAIACIAVLIVVALLVSTKPDKIPEPIEKQTLHAATPSTTVYEWTDPATGKRYLIFQRYTNTLFVLEAPLK